MFMLTVTLMVGRSMSVKALADEHGRKNVTTSGSGMCGETPMW